LGIPPLGEIGGATQAEFKMGTNLVHSCAGHGTVEVSGKLLANM
jgi:hypothetical protein